jgi:hypothetical protein
MIAITAQFAPGLGGAFAILVAVSCLIGNGTAIAAHVNERVSAKPATIGDL